MMQWEIMLALSLFLLVFVLKLFVWEARLPTSKTTAFFASEQKQR